MFKKILLLLVILTIVSCNTTKPAIVTTKLVPGKVKKTVSHSTKNKVKPTAKGTDSRTPNRGVAEVIESSSRTSVTNDVIGDYIFEYKDIAMGNMKKYGIPASIILAQGILESGAGRGTLAMNANNHFGIKCHTGWEGDSVKHDDDASQECFRKYSNPAESFDDHALFLTGRSRYASLFSLPKEDYKAWAIGLRKAGYATDPKYPEKLISYIERYNLEQYDNQALGRKYVPSERQTIKIASVDNRSGSFYEVQKGDTLYSISKKFNLMVDQLKQNNNLSDNTLSIGQKLRVN
ncbi:glucosaminidase domain-containing protein [Flavobacterium acetivorans]|uniref:glucosaminidase domain-containing protein n=1 Tax=Flavobacterium acetivorans TaxID=2893883 RepID=UPI001E62C31D|nr:glucosaminidase domain-containing protein [Flavobacterium sp. F-29]UFH36832.1 glucosaminidase domain-containing protein [Flavobacterium sp. F-29]